MRRTLLRVGLSVGLTVASAAFALTRLEPGDLGAIIARLDPWFLAALAGCHLALIVLRALRISDQLGRRLSARILQATSIHNFLAAVMPLRSGDLSLPLVLRVRMAVPLADGALILLKIRLFDLAVCAGLGLSAAAFAPALAGEPSWRWGAALAGLALLAGAAAASASMARLDRALARLWARLGRRPSTTGETHPARPDPSPAGKRLFAWSLATWIVLLLGYVLAVGAVGLSADLPAIVAAGAAASLVFALPINGIGSYGPTQIAFATALSAFGYAFDAALVASLLMQTASLLVLGMAAAGSMLLEPGAGAPSGSTAPNQEQGETGALR